MRQSAVRTLDGARQHEPEQELLLAACRFVLGLAGRDDVAHAAAGVLDWSDIVGAAGRHAVLPLLYVALAAAGPLVGQHVPSDVADELKRHFDGNALHNVALARYLTELGDRFTAAGVAFMPIKGPSLTVAAYGDLSLRQFSDLDLVIHRRDLRRVRALLRDDGYAPVNVVTESLDDLVLDPDYHLPLRNDATGVSLEIHWALGRRGFGSLRREDWAWTNVTTMSVLGRSLPALDARALIVYLCVHGAKHNWAQLVRVCDVYAAVRSAPDLDWIAVRALAAPAGVARMLEVGIGLCDTLLGADLRGRGWVARADPVVQSLIDEAAHRCLTERPLSTSEQLRLQLRTRERVVDRVLLSLDVLGSPHVTDLNAVRLPPGLSALYHVVRPLRLVVAHARRWVTRSHQEARQNES
ncbi:MAG TPA: nucleotidyltransferase family protein [Gemmatimonadaceae bacterium]|nr:nucleotidyltransferase family protein [Gemmatimonadaceae bacterium]